VACHRSSCRRRRRTDVTALYPWHSDIGSLESDVFVASVKRGHWNMRDLSPKLLQTPEANRRHSADFCIAL
jgi:hypothetical protein